MKISPNLYGRMDGSKFWCFPWFPENSLLCVILRYTVYMHQEQPRKILTVLIYILWNEVSLITWEGPCAFPVTLYIPYLLGIICRPFLQYSISLSLRHSRAFMLVLVSFLCTYVVQILNIFISIRYFSPQDVSVFFISDCLTNMSKIFNKCFNEMKKPLYESNQKGKKSINTDFVLPSLYNHKSFVQGWSNL